VILLKQVSSAPSLTFWSILRWKFAQFPHQDGSETSSGSCKYRSRCRRTAEQGLVASVRGGQRAQALLPLVQDPAQIARVAQAADGHAMQVHGLHEVAQQRPLQAQDVPSEG